MGSPGERYRAGRRRRARRVYDARSKGDDGFRGRATADHRESRHHVETQGSSEAPFSFVADLAETLDWETAEEAGLTTRLGMVDRTVSELSPDERLELERLLNEALAKPGA
jgi:hypothetical protein